MEFFTGLDLAELPFLGEMDPRKGESFYEKRKK